jgi:hypothetical protein
MCLFPADRLVHSTPVSFLIIFDFTHAFSPFFLGSSCTDVLKMLQEHVKSDPMQLTLDPKYKTVS